MAPPQLAHALALAAKGWHVFPLRPDTKRPALHGERHCPRTGPCQSGHRKWEQRATTDPTRIRACWGSGAYGIGVATGPSGLLVIDLDLPKSPGEQPPPEWAGHTDGIAVFHTLCTRHCEPVPDTLAVTTGSGGRHLVFTAPPGVRLGSSRELLGWKVDTRGWGGYIVAPGSTVDGRPYTITHDVPPAPLPAWLVELLTPAQPAAPVPVSVARVRSAHGYVDAALRNETDAVAMAPKGQRNATLVRAARALARFTTSGDLTEQQVEEALKAAAARCGLPERESLPAIRSAIRWAISNDKRRTA